VTFTFYSFLVVFAADFILGPLQAAIIR